MILNIQLIKREGTIELVIKDNGPGIPDNAFNKNDALGIELIKSLSDQIDAKYKISNNNGLEFRMTFKV